MDNEETTQDEFMTFVLGNMDYAVELPKIREILAYPELVTTLPNTSDWVKGLINLRGEVVPIMDIRIKFNTGEIKYDENTAVIAIATSDDRMIGLVVDKVDDVKKIDQNALVPVTDMGSAIPSRYLKGFVRLDSSKMLVVMDIDSILTKEELLK